MWNAHGETRGDIIIALFIRNQHHYLKPRCELYCLAFLLKLKILLIHWLIYIAFSSNMYFILLWIILKYLLYNSIATSPLPPTHNHSHSFNKSNMGTHCEYPSSPPLQDIYVYLYLFFGNFYSFLLPPLAIDYYFKIPLQYIQVNVVFVWEGIVSFILLGTQCCFPHWRPMCEYYFCSRSKGPPWFMIPLPTFCLDSLLLDPYENDVRITSQSSITQVVHCIFHVFKLAFVFILE